MILFGVVVFSRAWHRRLARKHRGAPCGCESCHLVATGFKTEGHKGSPKVEKKPRARRGVRRRAKRED